VDVVVKGRGISVSEQLRRSAEHKLGKIVRLEPRAARVEVEVSTARSSRPDGLKRLDATLEIPRKVFRARAEGPEVEAALDQIVARLERQVRDHRDRRRNRLHGRNDRLQSAPVNPQAPAAE
jgi:putative sigma-54 modulation protein